MDEWEAIKSAASPLRCAPEELLDRRVTVGLLLSALPAFCTPWFSTLVSSLDVSNWVAL